jgi:hypothetical protein
MQIDVTSRRARRVGSAKGHFLIDATFSVSEFFSPPSAKPIRAV